jgi:broad specificity phosphatase PhoE
VRRRLVLMRHGAVSYFGEGGRPVSPDDVALNEEGRRQARAAAEALEVMVFDRVVTSGLPRTVETARIVVPERELEEWPELREIRGGRLGEIPEDELENTFVHAFRGVVPPESQFLGGESIGELWDRVLPAFERLLADDWDTALAVLHGGVNRAILSWALTGQRLFLGAMEQAAGCINLIDVGAEDWVVRAVNIAPLDVVHVASRLTQMEQYWREFLPYRGRMV